MPYRFMIMFEFTMLTRYKELPADLLIIAALFAGFGLVALLRFVFGLAYGEVEVSLDLLFLPVGVGLLQLKKFWHTCALVLIVLYGIGLPVLFLLVYFTGSAPVHVTLFGSVYEAYAPAGMAVVSAAVVAYLTIALWIWWKLTRPKLRNLFYEGKGASLPAKG